MYVAVIFQKTENNHYCRYSIQNQILFIQYNIYEITEIEHCHYSCEKHQNPGDRITPVENKQTAKRQQKKQITPIKKIENNLYILDFLSVGSYEDYYNSIFSDLDNLDKE